MGNSQLIAAKHYLQVTDEHFAKATRNPTRAAAEMSDESGNGVIRPLRDNEKAPEFPGLSQAGFSRRNLQSQKMPPTGVEPVTYGLGNRRSIQLSYGSKRFVLSMF